MSTVPHPETPTLAPPGAGIPAVERLVGGTIFAFRRWRGTPDAWTAVFQRERRTVDQLVQGAGARALGARVLIPRLRGLEDSSRFWSVWMTLDHLCIVNTQIAMVMRSLLAGRTPPGKASTAAVKPRPEADATVLAPYLRSCDAVERVVAECLDGATGRAARTRLATGLRFPHPWFGPLDAAGWHALAAMHMGIHRRQIEHILAGAGEASRHGRAASEQAP